MTYDEAQVAKPLKRCPKCGRDWYMLAPICAECRNPYAKPDVRDVNGVVMNAGE